LLQNNFILIALTTCSSPDGREGTCLAELTIPSLWWPSVTSSAGFGPDASKATAKQPKVTVKVSYSVFETKGQNCLSEQGEEGPDGLSWVVRLLKLF
jgi:hypothetical protein